MNLLIEHIYQIAFYFMCLVSIFLAYIIYKLQKRKEVEK